MGGLVNPFATVDVVDLVHIVVVPDVVVIDVDIDVSPAPTAAISPAISPCDAKGDPCSKSESGSRYIARVDIGRIRINRRTVDYDGIVRGNIDDLGIGLLNDDDLFTCLHSLNLNRLFRAPNKDILFLGLESHVLH